MPRKILFAFIILFVIFLVIVQAKKAPLKQGPYQDTLVWGVSNKPTLINPILTTQSISASLELLIFNSLARVNSKGEIEPDLAEKWEVSPDGLVYTFYLRKGVRFHDGRECTAWDVKFTYDKIIDPQVNSPFRPLYYLVQDLQVIDNYTFQITLSKPYPSFIYTLVREIVPRHLLENTDLKDNPFNFKPIGTGPFRLKEWNKDNQITLEQNPDYYEGRPNLGQIIVRSFLDSQGLWSALMRQEIDLAMFISRDDYEIIKNDPVFKTYTFPVDGYYSIIYNLEDPILMDKRVREAIAYGINRKDLIKKIEAGYGLESNGPFYPDSVGFNPRVKPIEFNPTKAIELLNQAGWEDIDHNGILEKEGRELEVRILIDSRQEICQRMAMLIRQQLQEIGIKLIVQLYSDDSILTPEFLRQSGAQAQLKLLWAGQNMDQVIEGWFSECPESFYSPWKYKNPEVDRYFASAKTTREIKKKKWIYQEIYRFIYEDQPATFLYFPFCFHAVSSRFQNIDQLFNLSMPYYTIKDWSVLQGSVKKERR